MQRRDVAPKRDVLLLNNNKEKFDAIVERVKKYEEQHPDTFEFPVSDEDALASCSMIGLERRYDLIKQDIKNAKSEEEKRTAKANYYKLVYFVFAQLGWYLY